MLPVVCKLRLPTLRHFGLVRSQLYEGAFLRLCTSPLMEHVRSLHLDQFNNVWLDLKHDTPNPVDEEEFAAGFAALKRLEEITLTQIVGFGWILPQLRHMHAPALTRVLLEFDAASHAGC